MNGDQLRALRAGAQRLDAHRGSASALDVVRHLVAVQAQDLAAATLGVAVRADTLTTAAVDEARNQHRSIVRLWCLRGTLHLVGAQDVRWLLDLVRPRLATANRRRRTELGLDDDATARGVRLITEHLLARGPRTRPELAEHLHRNGIASAGQATIHVIWRAAVDGLVCYGPDVAGEETFVALEDWLGRSHEVSPSDPALELARRYLAAYGPVTPADFSAWSGLPRGIVRSVWSRLGSDAVPIDTPYGQMWHLSGATPSNAAAPPRLLPAFDSVWVGYANHEPLMSSAHGARVFPGGGIIRPLVFANGRIVGTWTRRTTLRGIELTPDLFEPVADALLEQAVDDFGRLLQRPARLVMPRAS